MAIQECHASSVSPLVTSGERDAGLARDEPDFAVVIVSFDNRAYLEPCLRTLSSQRRRSTCEIVVVDNGSTDGSQEMLRREFPEVLLLENTTNIGLAAASNQGILATRSRHVLLLNDDTEPSGASLDALVAFMDTHPDAAAAGGVLLNGDGTVQAGFNDFPTLRQEFLAATRIGAWVHPAYPSRTDPLELRPVDWLGSACLMLRRAALDEVGLLDEQYFIYGDEADLQYRLRAAGWRVYFLPHVRTVHFGGRSLDRWRRRRLVYRGKLLFYRKNYGRAHAVSLAALFAGLAVLKLAWWSALVVVPSSRERVRREIASNLEVLRVCRGALG